MTRCFSVTVSGKVQGVFFRASARQKADELQMKGFVRNEPNGDVYLEVEGDGPALEDFLSWCRHGPSRARVEKCEIREILPKNYKRFEIA
jgi:acylphosphatase